MLRAPRMGMGHTNGKVLRVVVTAAALVVIAAGLKLASAVVVPIVLAGFLAFVSAPLVFRMHRAKVPYAVAVGIVLVAMLGI